MDCVNCIKGCSLPAMFNVSKLTRTKQEEVCALVPAGTDKAFNTTRPSAHRAPSQFLLLIITAGRKQEISFPASFIVMTLPIASV